MKNWSSAGSQLPVNFATGREYNGINILVLWVTAQKLGYTSNQWATYKQSQSKDLQVKKNSKGSRVVFYKQMSITDELTDEEKNIPMVRMFTVFNRDQLSGECDEVSELPDFLDVELFINNIDAGLIVGEPAYLTDSDVVSMPLKSNFAQASSYYSTYLHELTHWTGHQSRLDRGMKNRFGSDAYAAEELVAELGSAFLCAEFGIAGETRHARYIDGWLKILKADKKPFSPLQPQLQKHVNIYIV